MEVPYDRLESGEPSGEPVLSIPDKSSPDCSYSVYMGDDKSETVIMTHRPELPDILIWGDSFTNPLESLAYMSFDEMRSLDFRYYKDKTLTEYIKEYKPDIVVCVRDDLDYLFLTENGDMR